MTHLLIFCYQQKRYVLIEEQKLPVFSNCEVLYEFDNESIRMAEKILINLERERSTATLAA